MVKQKMTIMNKILLALAFFLCANYPIHGQNNVSTDSQMKAINSLIDTYLDARENKNEEVLRDILDPEIDQLVSSGVWRVGIRECIDGMMQSSVNNPGKRTIVVDKIKLLNPEAGIADAKYEIINADGSVRKMWSTFILVRKNDNWRIAGIRNMRYDGL